MNGNIYSNQSTEIIQMIP